MQLYFYSGSPWLKSVPPKMRRRWMTGGALKYITSVDRLKLCIVELRWFDISKIVGDKVIKIDGTEEEAQFELTVNDDYIPMNANDIYCLWSTKDNLIYEGNIINIHRLAKLNNVPLVDTPRINDVPSDHLRDPVTIALGMYGKLTDAIINIKDDTIRNGLINVIDDKDIEALGELEKYIKVK